VPSERALQAEELVAGWQLVHALPGFTVPDGCTLPEMLHTVPHWPPPQY
jgi:hypothetical protein